MASHLILTLVQSLSKKTCCVFNRWKNVETHKHDFTRTMTSTPEYETSLFSDSSTTRFSDHRDRSTTPPLFIPLLVKQQEVHKLQGHGLFFNQQSTDHHRQAAQVLHITCLPVSVCFSRTVTHQTVEWKLSMFQPRWKQQQISSSAFTTSHMWIEV